MCVVAMTARKFEPSPDGECPTLGSGDESKRAGKIPKKMETIRVRMGCEFVSRRVWESNPALQRDRLAY